MMMAARSIWVEPPLVWVPIFSWNTCAGHRKRTPPLFQNIAVSTRDGNQQVFEQYLRHYDASSECATARQHKVAAVACYRLERTLMGCADPPRRGSRRIPSVFLS